MGSLHKSKSTRARRARSVRTPPKPRRKPAINPLKNPLLHRLAGALGDNREQRAEAILKAARTAEPVRKDGAPTMTLQMVQAGLETASALISVCANALEAQAADSDTDVAIVLQRCALDTLGRQMDRIELLLKEVRHE
jgi:hypothetical protein